MKLNLLSFKNYIELRGLLALTVVLILGALVSISALGFISKYLAKQESAEYLIQIGNNIVSDLTIKTAEFEALTSTLGTFVENVEKDSNFIKSIFPILVDFKNNQNIAGGGIWPEPFNFDATTERRSFFWGRENDKLVYTTQYNNPDIGYHDQEWYVVANHLERGRCAWSHSYMDPVSYQPMVTSTVATYCKGKYSGNVTIDIKLDVLQSFAEDWELKTGGHVFISDQHNRFITFHNPDLVKNVSVDNNQNRTEEFLTASAFADKEPTFAPIAKAMEEMNISLIKKATQMPGYKAELIKKIMDDSKQIDSTKAVLISAIIADPLGKNTFFGAIDIEQDIFSNRKSVAYCFYVPKSYWKVIIVTPESKIYGLAETLKLWHIFISFIVISLIILLVHYAFSRYFVTPLQKTALAISNMQSQLSAPDFKFVLPEVHYKNVDEIGQILMQYNNLILTIEKINSDKIDYWKLKSSTLEKKVEEITKLSTTHNASNFNKNFAPELMQFVENYKIDIADIPLKYNQLLEKLEKLQKEKFPIINLSDNVIYLPVIINLENNMWTDFAEHALNKAVETKTEIVILNLSQVTINDSALAAKNLITFAKSLKLGGVLCCFVEIPVKLIKALVVAESPDIESFPSLQKAIEHYYFQNKK